MQHLFVKFLFTEIPLQAVGIYSFNRDNLNKQISGSPSLSMFKSLFEIL